MNNKEIFEQIKHNLSDVFKIELEKINYELNIDDVDEWDSLTHLILIMNIEEKMSVKFDIENIGNLKSISAIIEEINKKLNNK